MIKLMKRCLIQIKNLLIYNFSFFAFINWCIKHDSKSRNILYKYHPFFIGENDAQAAKSLILIRGKSFNKETNLNNFEFQLSKDYYFLIKGLCVPFLRFFNYEFNYLHKVTKVSYNSNSHKFLLVFLWLIGLILVFLIILSSSKYDLKSIDYKNWPIVHIDSNFTSFYQIDNDKKAAEYFQTNLMGNVQCFFDVIITSIFISSNIALTNEILNKPGYTGIYITIGLGIFDIYILSSLIFKAKFDYYGTNCLYFLFDTWKNFDKIINSFVRITALTNKKIFLDDEREKNKRNNEPDCSRKLRFLYNFFFWIFILVWLIFCFILVIQTFIFLKCSILFDLFINLFSNAIFINMCVTFGYIFLVPLTVLPFQYFTCSIVFFLLYLKDKIILLFKKKDKNKITPNVDVSKTKGSKSMDIKVEDNLSPKLKLESDALAESLLDIDQEKNKVSKLGSEALEESFVDLEADELKTSEVEEVLEKSVTDIESPKREKNNSTKCEDEDDLYNIKSDSVFTMFSFPFIFLALCCKIQYTYPLLISAKCQKESAVKIAFGLPFLSLSYYTILIERLPSKFDQTLVKLRIMLKFVDSLF